MSRPESGPKRPNFLISKWYMDCVADDGSAFIGYAATLRWKALSLDYSSTLRQAGDRPAEVRTSVSRPSTPPNEEGDAIRWRSDSLSTAGTWRPIAMPIEQTILESDAGSIRWRCVAPLADATVSRDKGDTLSGLGYCEHISISITPWQMPIDELRWGRFLTRNSYVVWIDHKGPEPVTLVFVNGRRVERATIEDDMVQLEDGHRTLSLFESRTLREGPLVSTAFSSVPLLSKLLSSNGLMIDETKWCSRGMLTGANLSEEQGWAIHEVVRWIR
ncbi:MAG: hypothetical protein ABR535_07315 [Pyrinomonadaceae bacterium]